MNEDSFVPYKESIKLRELGFKDSCLGCYDEKGIRGLNVMSTKKYYINSKEDTWNCAMPLWQQAFDFIESKFGTICNFLGRDGTRGFTISGSLGEFNSEYVYNTKYDTREACLKKLIRFIEGK